MLCRYGHCHCCCSQVKVPCALVPQPGIHFPALLGFPDKPKAGRRAASCCSSFQSSLSMPFLEKRDAQDNSVFPRHLCFWEIPCRIILGRAEAGASSPACFTFYQKSIERWEHVYMLQLVPVWLCTRHVGQFHFSYSSSSTLR